jgi:zinc D-Ala-D-Ala carboxypeptidase
MGQRLTANFTLAELTKTRHDLDNTPSPQVVQNLQLLAEKVLQPLRDAVGPVNVTSGYRSKLVNQAVNGARNSDHLWGYAADLQSPDGNHRKLYDWLKANAMFSQLIYEFGNDTQPQWVHVSYNPKDLKREILRARNVGKRVTYSRLQP